MNYHLKTINIGVKSKKHGYILKTLKVVQSKMALNPFFIFGCVEDKGGSHIILFRDEFDLRIWHTGSL